MNIPEKITFYSAYRRFLVHRFKILRYQAMAAHACGVSSAVLVLKREEKYSWKHAVMPMPAK